MYGMSRADVYETPWHELVVYRHELHQLPPPGVVYIGDPTKK